VAGTVLGLADWALVEDLGSLGGVGTDPNSMVPMVMLSVAGYLVVTRAPSSANRGVDDAGALPGPLP
jgi:hypothetical protein